jgi:CHAT domain-containing protein
VHLVAEGPLTQLPWGALPDGRDRYLVESGPTIHVLAAERDLLAAPADPEAGTLLALGDVAFDKAAVREGAPKPAGVSTRSVLRACGSDRPLAFPPLPGTGREIDEIARVHSGDEMLLRGAEATEAAFKAAAPGRGLLHLATHAVLLDDDCALNPPGMRGVGGLGAVPAAPSASAASAPSTPSPWLGRRAVLALSGADRAGELDGDENEGLLTAEEVATLDLRGVDWVVLSACESGVADTWAREGRLGLTRAFHLAGAHAVIASLWPIDDDATVALMARLYAARAAGVTSAGEAMRRASCDVIAARRAAGLDTHPFAWAAFTPSGD